MPGHRLFCNVEWGTESPLYHMQPWVGHLFSPSLSIWLSVVLGSQLGAILGFCQEICSLPGHSPWDIDVFQVPSTFPSSFISNHRILTNFWLKQLKFYVITVLEATKNSSAVTSWQLLNNFVVRNRTNESMFRRGGRYIHWSVWKSF